jgi:outer membrane protein OmpU
MKKLLLSSAAVAGLVAFAATPAHAQIEVSVGGHSKNYVGWMDQDTAVGADHHEFDMLRESELHFDAVGVADNGLEYGFHAELEVDAADSANTVEESYLFLSGDWGRVNLGSEDGANFLLQVAAPSADSNIDGIRQDVNPVNYAAAVVGAGSAGFAATGAMSNPAGTFDAVDYDNDETGKAQKLTYLSPVMNGFQAGISYTPDVLDGEAAGPAFSNALSGFNADTATFEEAYDLGLRYEGTFNNVGVALGGGYTHVENNSAAATADDLKEWNVGIDLDIGAFGVGAVYTEENRALDNNGDSETWVAGVDYTTGPFKLGASYFTNDTENGAGVEYDTDRYTGGVIYTAAEGLTFRGTVSHIEHEGTALTDTDATSILGGVQFNF